VKIWPEQFPLFPERATELAREIDAIYFFGLGVATVFSLLIAVLVLYFGVRYRRTHEDEVGRPEKAAAWLEIAWSIVPLGILLFMFGWGAKIFFEARRPPSDAVRYYATAKQWMWKFQHPQGNREINELHVPVGVPIELVMTSEDVIHSFFVPEFRTKMDVLPGRFTNIWFEIDRVGTYRLFCNEYCGVEHSLMIGSVIAMEPSDYERWLAGGQPVATLAKTGEQVFAEKTCNTCHKNTSGALGPSLDGVFGSVREFGDGTSTVADENYIRESILEPRARLVQGYQALMPTFQGQVDEEELVLLIEYIKSLSGEADEG
jgi:cytochrome c oxidase subunit 2